LSKSKRWYRGDNEDFLNAAGLLHNTVRSIRGSKKKGAVPFHHVVYLPETLNAKYVLYANKLWSLGYIEHENVEVRHIYLYKELHYKFSLLKMTRKITFNAPAGAPAEEPSEIIKHQLDTESKNSQILQRIRWGANTSAIVTITIELIAAHTRFKEDNDVTIFDAKSLGNLPKTKFVYEGTFNIEGFISGGSRAVKPPQAITETLDLHLKSATPMTGLLETEHVEAMD
tara:strand:+ start:536 stop:1219 length:684 start_codon:yes stop_codon:yes gene_type:complete